MCMPWRCLQPTNEYNNDHRRRINDCYERYHVFDHQVIRLIIRFNRFRVNFFELPLLRMKKLLAILILMVYGLSSTGMTLHFQYCCGKFEKIDLVPISTKNCAGDNGIKEANKKCCDDKEVHLKISSDQSASKILLAASYPIEIKTAQPDFFLCNPLETKKLLPEVFAPPPLSPLPLFILNSVFRI